MTTLTQKTLGVTILISGIPTDVEGFDTLAKENGACLQLAIENVVYRSYLASYRTAFIEALEKETGILRATEGEGDEAKIVEKDTVYIKRLREIEEVSESTIAEVAQTVADARPFNVNPVSASKVGKKYIELAEGVIDTAETKHDGDYSKFMENLGNANPGLVFQFDENGKPTRESIAVALRTNEERILREQNDTMFS